jgi:hypothetical protein
MSLPLIFFLLGRDVRARIRQTLGLDRACTERGMGAWGHVARGMAHCMPPRALRGGVHPMYSVASSYYALLFLWQ